MKQANSSCDTAVHLSPAERLQDKSCGEATHRDSRLLTWEGSFERHLPDPVRQILLPVSSSLLKAEKAQGAEEVTKAEPPPAVKTVSKEFLPFPMSPKQ